MAKFLTATSRTLANRIEGFQALSATARKRIEEFSLLWQVFELQEFDTNFRPDTARQRLFHDQDADTLAFKGHNQYVFFRNRYFVAQGCQERFQSLISVKGINVQADIERGLEHNSSSRERLMALTFICYRLRNNLFHGAKAQYGYKDQSENFTHAVRFLNLVLAR